VQLFQNFALATDYLVLWSTQNLHKKTSRVYIIFLLSLFYAIEQKNGKKFFA